MTCCARMARRNSNASGGGAPIGQNPDFGEVLVLAVVPMILGEHFPQFPGKFVRPGRGVEVVPASLEVANSESRAAAIAELKRLDRVGRILRDFFVKNSYRTIQIIRHVILRWG
jgi:hypothetical protein